MWLWVRLTNRNPLTISIDITQATVSRGLQHIRKGKVMIHNYYFEQRGRRKMAFYIVLQTQDGSKWIVEFWNGVKTPFFNSWAFVGVRPWAWSNSDWRIARQRSFHRGRNLPSLKFLKGLTIRQRDGLPEEVQTDFQFIRNVVMSLTTNER